MNIFKFIKNNKIILLTIVYLLICIIYLYIQIKQPYKDSEYKYIHKILLENLEKTIKIFEKHNINYWATFGTLLGSVRDNKIIDYDDDIDLTMLESDFNKLKTQSLLKDFNDSNLHLIIGQKSPLSKMRPEVEIGYGLIKVVSKREDNDYTKNYIFIDIVGMKKSNDKYILSDERQRKAPWPWTKHWYTEKELFPLKKGKLNHININIPKNGEEFLKRVYGDCKKDKCWKIPDNKPGHHQEEINLI